jgi:hypothetical protein
MAAVLGFLVERRKQNAALGRRYLGLFVIRDHGCRYGCRNDNGGKNAECALIQAIPPAGSNWSVRYDLFNN